MSKKPESPEPPIVLTVSLIESGKFIRAGEPTPYLRAADVPAHLKEYIADGSEDFYTHSERLIYDQQPGPEPGGVVFQQTGGGGQWRQARQAAATMEQQAWAEQQAEIAGRLPEETEQALQAAHEKSAALAKAEMAHAQKLTDAAYEAAEQEAAAKEARQQLYVRRGGEFGRVERARLKAGEPVFALRENGQYEVVGKIDSRGQPPDQEIIL